MSDDRGLLLRRADEADRPAVVSLLGASLGRGADPRYEALFAWKHEDNAFGVSPAWVALDGDRLVGYRALMRWRFEWRGRTVVAVRAVDTATHPEYQGRGIFTRLTRLGLAELGAEGVGFVFNTPNDQSRPGYLKMGWVVVGRLPVSVRARSVVAAARMLRARVPAERWSAPCDAGEPAAELLTRRDAVRGLLASQTPAAGIRTARSPEYLTWRYGSGLLPYRVLAAPGGLEDGLVVFRVRERGAAREVVLAELLVPDGDARLGDALLARLRREVDAEYVIRIGGAPIARNGFMRLPRQGPILTWRALGETTMPPLAAWDVTLGDIEVF